jgi:Tol biopolymer transport system component
LLDVYPAPVGKYVLIELSCPNGQTVVFLDTESGSVTRPVTDTDSHFLAWAPDGKTAYLKADSLGNAHITRMDVNGKDEFIPITEFTYDIAVDPGSSDFMFTFSRGLGQGSELWHAKDNGKVVQQLYADKSNYISFARYSPHGTQIAFIKVPDSQTPFTIGELWAMNADGSSPRKLADVDAGHGFAANWSPDGPRIAFVKRENPAEERANQASESLISNIYLVNVESREVQQVTHLGGGYVETAYWSPDGNTLAFTAVLNGRMEVQIVGIASGKIRTLITETACCPAWMRKEVLSHQDQELK